MAEGLLAHLLPTALKPLVTVRSAGTQGLHGNMADPFAVQAVSAYGVDIGDHRARILDAGMVKAADLVLAMERYQLDQINRLRFFRCKYATLLGLFAADRPDPEIEDPYRAPLDAYVTCAQEIADCMPGLITYIWGQVAARTA